MVIDKLPFGHRHIRVMYEFESVFNVSSAVSNTKDPHVELYEASKSNCAAVMPDIPSTRHKFAGYEWLSGCVFTHYRYRALRHL